MSDVIEVRLHEIAADGLPDMDDQSLVGRVAFLFDGNVISGWPLIPKRMKREGLSIHPAIEDHAAQGDVLWESDTDVGDGRMKAGVTHWIEFPVPVWDLARSGSDSISRARPAESFVGLLAPRQP